jgi:cytochrome c peroxidase
MRNSQSSEFNRTLGVLSPAAVLLTVVGLAGVGVSVASSGAFRSEAAAVLPPNAAEYARTAEVAYPEDNRPTAARELLGRTLFFDPRLSGSNWISCASCHNPGFSWGDGLPKAIGHGMQQLGRRTPTLLNLAWSPALFWDGRAETLEEQALGPIQAPGEMNLSLPQLEERLRSIAGYRRLFEDAYPGEEISAARVASAIATFERTIVSGEAPFDRWIAGDAQAITAPAQRGFALFNGKARCNVCHTGWRLTDDSFHDVGVEGDDPGRGRVLPKLKVAQFAFKTPTLRNVASRAPYLHNGSAATLMAVIELYDQGGLVRRPTLSPEIKPLGLSQSEKQELVEFLQTLTSRDAAVSVPALPH